ncbi:MAG: AbrB/MazE/SpoVT family DNA-binding domain-containing protein [Proteobacteria bacterium]|nr:AbrB/MazE/SpoVT family DNA-binding domain-containing protein [Pseudomonadota bacterium]
MAISTVSTKGQITLPAEMRRKLGVKPQDRIILEMEGDAILITKAHDFFELEGFLGPAKPPEEERDQMQRAVARHRAGGVDEKDIH